MFNKLVTSIVNYEKWFESLSPINAMIEINNNCLGGGVEESIFYKTLFKETNKVKFMLCRLMTQACHIVSICTKTKKLYIKDEINTKLYAFDYEGKDANESVRDFVFFLIDNSFIRFNKQSQSYDGISHHIFHLLIRRNNTKSVYGELSNEKENYLRFKTFIIGSSYIFKDVESMKFVTENCEKYKINPPQNDKIYSNERILTEIYDEHIMWKFMLTQDKLFSAKIPFGTSHIFIEKSIGLEQIEVVIPIFIKVDSENISIYDKDGNWINVGTGVLDETKMIKVN